MNSLNQIRTLSRRLIWMSIFIALGYFITYHIKADTKQSLKEFRIPLATSLARTELGANSKALVIYVWREDCVFCNKLEKEILRPMLISGDYYNRLTFRKLELGSNNKLTDFAGNNTTVKRFLSSYKANVTPTLLFLSQDGVEIADRLVGYQGEEFYWHYFEQSIQQANQYLSKNLAIYKIH